MSWVLSSQPCLPLMEIWISPPCVEAAEINCREGRPSRTAGPMSVVSMDGSGFYLWDGYHRLVERTTKGEELEFKVEHWDGWPEMLPEEDRHVLRKISEWKSLRPVSYEKEIMSIQVNDKVKWSHSFQALNQQCFGHVVSTHVKVMGNPCFLIQSSIDNRQVTVSKDKVSKV